MAWALALSIGAEPLCTTLVVNAAEVQEESQESSKTRDETNSQETNDSSNGNQSEQEESQNSQDQSTETISGSKEDNSDDTNVRSGSDTQEEVISEDDLDNNISLEDSEKASKEDSSESETFDIEEQEDEMEALNQRAKEELAAILNQKEILGTVYNCSTYEINEEADCFSNVVSTVSSGQQVFVEDVEIVDHAIWYKIHFAQNDQVSQGYILDDYVVCVDQDFTTWRDGLLQKIIALNTENSNGAALFSTSSFDQVLANFPSSYRAYLKKLHSAHPKWTFVPHNTGLDWSTVISNEMYPTRNLIEGSNIASWKSMASGDYDSKTGKWSIKSAPNWVQASKAIVKYYMDPRNFLNETGIYQFELQTFNSNYHTQAGVELIIKGTFMEGAKVKSGMTYAQAFMKIGKELNVSPYLLASRVRQEQGVNGDSALISGKVSGYEGYYNYFNIEAYGETREQIIANGMKEAKKEGWNSIYKALYGGSKKVAQNYISQGQDTFYLQKFDVDSSYNGCYWHQYMQNLQAAESESKNVKAAYTSMGVIDNTYVFKIPVYDNMPSSASAKPTKKTPGKAAISSASSAGYNKIKITWKKVSGASGYYIYRSTSKNGTYSRVETVKGGSNTSVINSGLKTGKRYYYKVRAYTTIEGVKLFGKYSNYKSAKAKPSKTQITKKVSTDYRSIKLTWKKVSGATGYEIYRATKKSGTYKLIRTINSGSKTTYTNKKLTTGINYYYKIRVFRNVGSKKYYSSFSSIVSKKAVPQTPKITSISSTDTTKIKLNWNKVDGSQGYEIYRAASKNGKYNLVKTITKGTITSFTDTGLTSGKKYYYRVKAYRKVNGKAVQSSYSSKKNCVTK